MQQNLSYLGPKKHFVVNLNAVVDVMFAYHNFIANVLLWCIFVTTLCYQF